MVRVEIKKNNKLVLTNFAILIVSVLWLVGIATFLIALFRNDLLLSILPTELSWLDSFDFDRFSLAWVLIIFAVVNSGLTVLFALLRKKFIKEAIAAGTLSETSVAAAAKTTNEKETKSMKIKKAKKVEVTKDSISVETENVKVDVTKDVVAVKDEAQEKLDALLKKFSKK